MPLQMANIVLKNTKNQPSLLQTVLIILMVFQWEPMKLPLPGFKTQRHNYRDTTTIILDFNLRDDNTLDEIVITGTLKPVSRMESPVPVEVYKPFSRKINSKHL
jgi:outer membrane receptor for ferrienterochelin and colicins